MAILKKTISFKDQLSLNACQTYCRMLQGEHSTILLTSLSYQLLLRHLYCLILSGRFTQVVLNSSKYNIDTPHIAGLIDIHDSCKKHFFSMKSLHSGSYISAYVLLN